MSVVIGVDFELIVTVTTKTSKQIKKNDTVSVEDDKSITNLQNNTAPTQKHNTYNK